MYAVLPDTLCVSKMYYFTKLFLFKACYCNLFSIFTKNALIYRIPPPPLPPEYAIIPDNSCLSEVHHFAWLFLSRVCYVPWLYFYPKYLISLDLTFSQSMLFSIKFSFFYTQSTCWSQTNSSTTVASSHKCTFHYHWLPLRRLINDIGLGSGSWVYFNTMVTVGSDAELSVHGSSLLARRNIYKLRLTMANGCKLFDTDFIISPGAIPSTKNE